MSVADQSPSAKPISFVFHDMNQSAVPPKQMMLVIRPEDLTRTDTSRLTPHHTLGGAFADSFGKGLPSVQISGHTGWGSGSRPDGQAAFVALHKHIYTQWHQARSDAANQSNKDPDKVKLIFHDVLDDFTWVVAPLSFVLRRSVSNPLISHYQISLLWLDDFVIVPAKSPLSSLSKLMAAVKSFKAAMDKVTGFMKSVAEDINGAFAAITAPIQEVMNAAVQINQSVLGVLEAGGDIVSSVTGNVTGIAANLSFAASNILSAVIATASFPDQALHSVMQARSAWLNLFCIASNIINPQKLLPNYDSLYGASMCSSTAGGSPTLSLPTSNTLELVFPLPTGETMAINQPAANAINQVNQLDVSTMTSSQKVVLANKVNGLSTTIAGGMRLPATWQRPVNHYIDLVILTSNASCKTVGSGLLTADMALSGSADCATLGGAA